MIQKDYSKLKIRIFYMSGTGNSHRVATWMQEFSKKQGADSQIHSIDKIKIEYKTKEVARNLLGIVCPTHGFTAPWHVIKFALRLPLGRSTRAFTSLPPKPSWTSFASTHAITTNA